MTIPHRSTARKNIQTGTGIRIETRRAVGGEASLVKERNHVIVTRDVPGTEMIKKDLEKRTGTVNVTEIGIVTGSTGGTRSEIIEIRRGNGIVTGKRRRVGTVIMEKVVIRTGTEAAVIKIETEPVAIKTETEAAGIRTETGAPAMQLGAKAETSLESVAKIEFAVATETWTKLINQSPQQTPMITGRNRKEPRINWKSCRQKREICEQYFVCNYPKG